MELEPGLEPTMELEQISPFGKSCSVKAAANWGIQCHDIVTNQNRDMIMAYC